MLIQLLIYLSLSLLLFPLLSIDACTTIIVGKKATIDGSLMTTHNNDCTDCDIRMTIVQAKDHAAGSDCPIYPCHFTYPRFVGNSRSPAYSSARLDAEHVNTIDHTYAESQPIGHTAQVAHTYSYLDASYGIANEHQLAMGESTCAARLVAYAAPLGDAHYDITALNRLALERCATARCAITTMGADAEKFGFYGANEPPEEGDGLYEESGEALTIIDKNEAWVFHILPDDTGRGAIWAAQRVPDNHIAIVANKFTIRQMNLSDKDNFLASSNVVDVAIRRGFWPANRSHEFDFSAAYAPDANDKMGWADRRTWRIYDWAAPSLGLKHDQDDPYPFSVPVDELLCVHDLMAMNRDHFEGTPFDLSIGPAAGPYNNPNRYDRTARPEYASGFFERAISLHRTSYSFVAVSRNWLPDEVGGVVYLCHHAPHTSLFLPIFSATQSLPAQFETGNLYHLNRQSAWWPFASVNNFAEKSYVHIHHDIARHQRRLEYESNALVDTLSKEAVALLAHQQRDVVLQKVTQFTHERNQVLIDGWWQLFDSLIVKFRDGIELQSPTPPLNIHGLFYPAWFLGLGGYYNRGPMPITHYPLPPNPPHPEVLAQVQPSVAIDKHAARRYARRHVELPISSLEYKEQTLPSQLSSPGPAEQLLSDISIPAKQQNIEMDTTSSSFFSIFLYLVILCAVSGLSFYFGLVYQSRKHYHMLNDMDS